MKISDLSILTVTNILFWSRIVISLIFGAIILLLLGTDNIFSNKILNTIVYFILIIFAAIVGQIGCFLLRLFFVSKSKYPLVLNIICNMLGFGKKKLTKEAINIDLNNFIMDNKLSLCLYYINNPQYLILSFDKNKIHYFTQEYDWENFKWNYKIKSQGKRDLQLLEYDGINQNNERIKDFIEFEKIEAKENEVLLLFIIHDLLFGKSSSIYY
ncbi:hypothetical protein ACQWU4_08810 [Chryseobacterium sp. MIQD13]|uniref:hypothetical protein n=1 Tax=Chryseobacterium sp. MIQD13 TaxID=3422310 RepID=UPI003D298F83